MTDKWYDSTWFVLPILLTIILVIPMFGPIGIAHFLPWFTYGSNWYILFLVGWYGGFISIGCIVEVANNRGWG